MQQRTAALTAAKTGAVLAGAAVAGMAVLVTEGRLAKRAIGPQRTVPPYQDGRYGPRMGTSIRVAVLGDSAAAGLGADGVADTPAGVIARGVVEATGRPVSLINHAVVGARTADLDLQVTRALSVRPHVAVIIIGGNDITHLVPRRRSAQSLRVAIQRLVAAGSLVVIGTCPDLGTIKPIAAPLRQVGRRMSRDLAAAQHEVAVELGAIPVDLYNTLGPEFIASPETMFSADRFHPSSLGYRRMGAALLPAVLTSLGVAPAPARRMLTHAPEPSAAHRGEESPAPLG